MKKDKKERFIEDIVFSTETLLLKHGFKVNGMSEDEIATLLTGWKNVYPNSKKLVRGHLLWGAFLDYFHLKEKAATDKYDELKNINHSFFFFDMTHTQLGFRLGKGQKIPYTELADLHKQHYGWDMYFIGEDYKWTFVITHEEDFGPYFGETVPVQPKW